MDNINPKIEEYQKQDIDLVIDVLIKDLEVLGEDKDELEYWQSILEFMDSGQKDELASSLAVEKAKILKAKYKGIVPPEEESKFKNLISFLVGRKREAETRERERQDAQKVQELRKEITKMNP